MEEVKINIIPEREIFTEKDTTIFRLFPNGILEIRVKLDENRVVSYGILKYAEKLIDAFYMRKEIEAVRQKSFVRSVIDKLK